MAKGDVLTRLLEVFPADEGENREPWRQYLPHALSIYWSRKAVDALRSAELGYLIRWCLYSEGRVRESTKVLDDVVAIQEKTLPEDHLDRLASQHELARANHASGLTKSAIALLQHVVRVQEKSLTEDHPDQVRSQNLLRWLLHIRAKAPYKSCL